MESAQKPDKGVEGFQNGDVRGSRLDLLRISQAFSPNETRRCINGAPYIAIIKDGKGLIGQGNCDSWECPRCSLILAAYHRHRMVEGANVLLQTQPLYFWTITCRGKDLDLETADDEYLLWTNRLLTACRGRAKRRGINWAYVQVTERQKRGAAHSHFIHTFCPDDARDVTNSKGIVDKHSVWFVARNVSAGLGPQCRISEVQSAAGVGSYISGYLQKQLNADIWPEHWRRIRYSQSWPDTTEKPDWAKAVITEGDWAEIDKQNTWFEAANEKTYQYARHHMALVERPMVT